MTGGYKTIFKVTAAPCASAVVAAEASVTVEPDTPVITVSLLCGIERVRFLRLWRRAPRTTISPKLICALKGIGGGCLKGEITF